MTELTFSVLLQMASFISVVVCGWGVGKDCTGWLRVGNRIFLFLLVPHTNSLNSLAKALIWLSDLTLTVTLTLWNPFCIHKSAKSAVNAGGLSPPLPAFNHSQALWGYWVGVSHHFQFLQASKKGDFKCNCARPQGCRQTSHRTHTQIKKAFCRMAASVMTNVAHNIPGPHRPFWWACFDSCIFVGVLLRGVSSLFSSSCGWEHWNAFYGSSPCRRTAFCWTSSWLLGPEK